MLCILLLLLCKRWMRCRPVSLWPLGLCVLLLRTCCINHAEAAGCPLAGAQAAGQAASTCKQLTTAQVLLFDRGPRAVESPLLSPWRGAQSSIYNAWLDLRKKEINRIEIPYRLEMVTQLSNQEVSVLVTQGDAAQSVVLGNLTHPDVTHCAVRGFRFR